MTLTAAEQYGIELLNRARMDPVGEAKRYGLTLNEGLVAGTITSGPKQVLAPHENLDRSATAHSTWMIETDTFSHTGSNNTDPGQRMAASGYVFSGSWGWGENLALASLTGGRTENSVIATHQETLMNSPGHRVNILRDSFREIGYAQVVGSYGSYTAAIATQNYAYRSDSVYVTGVAYQDNNNNDFYNIGEGRASVVFAFEGSTSVKTATAGGYALRHAPASESLTVQVGNDTKVSLSLRSGNVKLDVVDGDHLLTNTNLKLLSGISDAKLIGIQNKNLVGSGADNELTGNRANNKLVGNGGDDLLIGNAGKDTLKGGMGNDTLKAGAGNDLLYGDNGNDVLRGFGGNDRLLGGGGHDRLEGGKGNDILRGYSSGDALRGGDGNDLIDGGTGWDKLFGGTGADRFQFRSGFDRDTLYDLKSGEGDRLQFDDKLWTGTLSKAGVVSHFAEVTDTGVLFNFGDGDQLLITNVHSLNGLAGLIDII